MRPSCTSATPGMNDAGRRKSAQSIRPYYVMIIPGVVLFFVFHTFPAIQGLFYSFTNWKGYGAWKIVGLKNYLHVFTDKRALNAYLFTFKFALVTTILLNIISLASALALNGRIFFKRLFRAIFFFPYILSTLIIGFIFKFIFSELLPPVGQFLGNALLSKSILGNPQWAWVGVMIVTIWQSAAFNTLIYLTGLQTVPKELYEAAEIDGANIWSQFRHITFPLIAPFFTINMVLAMKNFLMVFDPIMATTGGGPGMTTTSIALFIYRGGFQGGQFAYQSANAIIYFLIILIISFIQLKVLGKREEQL